MAFSLQKSTPRDTLWEEEFATQPEIERYLNFAVEHFHLRRHIRTGQRVVSATWNEADHAWKDTAEKGETLRARWSFRRLVAHGQAVRHQMRP